jgi:hypothetical protein
MKPKPPETKATRPSRVYRLGSILTGNSKELELELEPAGTTGTIRFELPNETLPLQLNLLSTDRSVLLSRL